MRWRKIKDIFYGGCCDDEKTKKTIKETYEKYGYLLDTHTAVAVAVYNEYREKTGDTTPAIIASTASPYKFANSVLDALGIEENGDDFQKLATLSKATNTPIPAPISALKGKARRFGEVIDRDEMRDAVCKYLKI